MQCKYSFIKIFFAVTIVKKFVLIKYGTELHYFEIKYDDWNLKKKKKNG
jgi:hypothetical protein